MSNVQPTQQQAPRPRPPAGGPPPRRAPRNPRVKPRAARQYATIHRVDAWSVLKYSLIINFALLLITMVAVTIVWSAIEQYGLISLLTETFAKFQLVLAFNPGNIAKAIFLVGLLISIIGAALNVFIAFFYNLLADLIGGVRIELASDE